MLLDKLGAHSGRRCDDNVLPCDLDTSSGLRLIWLPKLGSNGIKLNQCSRFPSPTDALTRYKTYWRMLVRSYKSADRQLQIHFRSAFVVHSYSYLMPKLVYAIL